MAPCSAQQTNSKNYIISRSFKQTGANENDVSKVSIQVQYFDGLGRPIQNVAVKQSPSGSDIVQPMAYDPFGRQSKQFLPYVAAGNGAFQNTAVSAANTWYAANSAQLEDSDLSRPYSETIFEPSPLERPSGIRQPGSKSSSSSISYQINGASEVKLYKVNNTTSTIEQNGFYAAGTLSSVHNTDEQGNISQDYTDKSGKTVCKKTVASLADTLFTYYIYDDLDRLRGVLQPKYQDNSSLNDFAFLYDYDGRGRIITKKIPGGGTVNIVYDILDRPVLTQDANQQLRGFWGFTKYDALGRQVMTGEVASANTRSQWQTVVNTSTSMFESTSTSGIGHTLTTAPPVTITESNLLTVTYYDNYNFPGSQEYFNYFIQEKSASVKSLTTGNRVRMLEGDRKWLVSTMYYDTEYRPIQTVRQLYDLRDGTIERVSTRYKYNLAPVVDEERTDHIIAELGSDNSLRSAGMIDNTIVQGPTSNTVRKVFQYDHADRLLSTKVQVSLNDAEKTAEMTTIANRYNALGQLKEKWLQSWDGQNFRRKTVFTNNIRGWNTEAKTQYLNHHQDAQNSNMFSYNLSYGLGNYTNGNISNILWKRGPQESDRGLSFSYDGANRLLGSFGEGGYTDTENLTYDKNGNILTLDRSGSVADQLVYTMSGNRATGIIDNSGNNNGFPAGGSKQYLFDANGNITTDGSKQATITYNLLNLPRTVAIAGKTLTYDYDAFGNKHKYSSTESAEKTVKYAGIFEYNQLTVPQRISIPDGQISLKSGNIVFNYYVTDHLGNVRMVFDQDGAVVQNTDYYPFGLEIDRNTPTQTPATRNGVNRYNFLGKETQIATGYIDLQARHYDPLIGRFMTIDPETEGQLEFSPYHYSFNNPIRFSDPDGRFPECCGGLGDFLTGVGQALSDDIIGGTPIRAAPGYVGAYNSGRTVGHYAAMVVGATEVAAGAIGDVAAVVGEIGSVGLATPVAVPVAAVSTAAIVHGAATGVRAAENLNNDKGRVNAEGKKGSEGNPHESSRAARRETMREQGIPTSIQPKSQSKNQSGREYNYGNKSVQQQTMDRSHQEKPHWEAGRIKQRDGKVQTNNYGRPKLENVPKKSKSYYNE